MWKFGSAALLELAKPAHGERVLDIGCGTGELTKEFAKVIYDGVSKSSNSSSCSSTGIIDDAGYILGIDADSNMISKATEQFPDIDFRVIDVRKFVIQDQKIMPFDLIVSNAVLHWIPVVDIDQAVENIARALKPGGRFVAEFGGKGNVQSIIDACRYATTKVNQIKENASDKPSELIFPYGSLESVPEWYFPSIGEFSIILEKYGIEVSRAELYDRPTPLVDTGDSNGIKNWIEMFGKQKLLPSFQTNEQRELFFRIIEDKLKQTKLYDPEMQQWVADYRRIRVVGIKTTM